jgi:ribose transport system permease protein
VNKPSDQRVPVGSIPLKARFRREFIQGRFDLVGLGVVLGCLCVLFSVLTQYFPTLPNLKALGVAVSYHAILAAAQTIVIIAGLIDLSFTAILALCGIAAQKLLMLGVPFAIIVIAVILFGMLLGLVNALVCVVAGVNPLIATIGTGLAFRGLAYIWLDLDTMPYFSDTAMNFIGNGIILGLPVPMLISVAVIAAIWILMRFTRLGSRIYAMGGSEAATRLAGVSVYRVKTLVFVISGASAAIGGLILTSLNGTAFPDAARGDELTVIAAVILGGTALVGGRGSVIGTMLAVLVLGVMSNGMNLLGVDAFWQVFLSGIILLLAVVVDEQRNRARLR